MSLYSFNHPASEPASSSSAPAIAAPDMFLSSNNVGVAQPHRSGSLIDLFAPSAPAPVAVTDPFATSTATSTSTSSTSPAAPVATDSPSNQHDEELQRRYRELQMQQIYLKQLQEQQKERLRQLEEKSKPTSPVSIPSNINNNNMNNLSSNSSFMSTSAPTTTDAFPPHYGSAQSIPATMSFSSIGTNSIGLPTPGNNNNNNHNNNLNTNSTIPSSPSPTSTTATSTNNTAAATPASASSNQQLQFMRWVQENLERMNRFMLDVDRRMTDLDARVQEILALQRIHAEDKHEILSALRTLRSDVSSSRAIATTTASTSPALSTNILSAASIPPSPLRANQVDEDARVARRLQEQFEEESKRQQQLQQQRHQSPPSSSAVVAPASSLYGHIANNASPSVTEATEPCPVCQASLPTQEELQAHVQAHFDDGVNRTGSAPAVASTIANAAAANNAAANGAASSAANADDKNSTAPWWKRVFGANANDATANNTAANANATATTTAVNTGERSNYMPQPPTYGVPKPTATATASTAMVRAPAQQTMQGMPMYYPAMNTMSSQLPMYGRSAAMTPVMYPQQQMPVYSMSGADGTSMYMMPAQVQQQYLAQQQMLAQQQQQQQQQQHQQQHQ